MAGNYLKRWKPGDVTRLRGGYIIYCNNDKDVCAHVLCRETRYNYYWCSNNLAEVHHLNVNNTWRYLLTEVLRYRKLGTIHRLAMLDYPLGYSDLDVHEDPSENAELCDDGPQYTHLFKILLLGAPRTGKTSLRYRFCRYVDISQNNNMVKYWPSLCWNINELILILGGNDWD